MASSSWIGSGIAVGSFLALVGMVFALVWKLGDEALGLDLHHRMDDPKNHRLTLLDIASKVVASVTGDHSLPGRGPVPPRNRARQQADKQITGPR